MGCAVKWCNMRIIVSCKGEKALAETGGTEPHFTRASDSISPCNTIL